MKCLMTAVLLLVTSTLCQAVDVKTYIPPNAVYHKDTLLTTQKAMWNTSPYPYLLPSQIEHESCVSLTSKKCWSSRSELKTAREYGVGLNMMTVAYTADGRERFNKFKELKSAIPELRNWQWADRYNARNQMIGIVWNLS